MKRFICHGWMIIICPMIGSPIPVWRPGHGGGVFVGECTILLLLTVFVPHHLRHAYFFYQYPLMAWSSVQFKNVLTPIQGATGGLIIFKGILEGLFV
ncbi:MAG TPA: hypothetical protein PKK85_07605 [Methanobacteriaceae archaeon]|nr:hypothetical protein [Methanobacteriaceae archaeon]